MEQINGVTYYTSRYAGIYSIRYVSPLTGKLTRIPKKKTGSLATHEAVETWAKEHLPNILAWEIAIVEKQRWRTFVKVVRVVEEYRLHRISEVPKSARQDLSFLDNYVLPFFVAEQQQEDANTWFRYYRQFKVWLRDTAKTEKGKPLAVSSANKAINALNHFMKFLRDYHYIAYENFRPLEAFAGRLERRRSADDVVYEEEFKLVWRRLQETNALYSDIYYVQFWTGMRVSEVIGLAFNFLTKNVPDEILSACKNAGYPDTHGCIVLESQPAQSYIKRIDGFIPRKPLKWRDEISPRNSRTVPIVDRRCWNILANRYKQQRELYRIREFGIYRESYLLFDGAQRNDYNEILREAYERVGLPYKPSHCLRHSRTTLWTLKFPPKILELILGHKAQSQERYIHINEIITKKAMEDADMDTIDIIGDEG
ncbi:MAG: hypothetical protein ACOH5I_26605 [Oligoflexus sp.]